MIYLSGVTSDRIEPDLLAHGVGLLIQPGNSYHLRVSRYPYWGADNGCFNPGTYKGDEAWLDWLDRLPRKGCLFAVVPDVARRPDGSLGGDPVATWAKFAQLAPLVQDMGFPAALAAQDGIENMANLREQLEALDCLFIAGSTAWKLGPRAEKVAKMARNMGKWVHMGRVNSFTRMERARSMGCNSADGTFLKYRLRQRGQGNIEKRGALEVVKWIVRLDTHRGLFDDFETPSRPEHRGAAWRAEALR